MNTDAIFNIVTIAFFVGMLYAILYLNNRVNRMKKERGECKKVIQTLVNFNLSLYDHVDSPSKESKHSLKIIWGRFPENIRESLESIKHLIKT